MDMAINWVTEAAAWATLPGNAFSLAALAVSAIAVVYSRSQAKSAERTRQIAELASQPAIDLIETAPSQWAGWFHLEFIVKNQRIVRLQVPRIRCKTPGYRLLNYRTTVVDDGAGAAQQPIPTGGVRVLQYDGEVRAAKDSPFAMGRAHLLVSEPVDVLSRIRARIYAFSHRSSAVRLEIETTSTMEAMVVTTIQIAITPPTASKVVQPKSVHEVMVTRPPNRWLRR
jgi:hypothetical protein